MLRGLRVAVVGGSTQARAGAGAAGLAEQIDAGLQARSVPERAAEEKVVPHE